jgi:hypothetical protein
VSPQAREKILSLADEAVVREERIGGVVMKWSRGEGSGA